MITGRFPYVNRYVNRCMRGRIIWLKGMHMEIRKSRNSDIESIMDIYLHAREFMKEHGNPNQWGPTSWPPEYLIEEDIQKGNSYVCVNEEDEILGTFFFLYGEDIEPTYRNIEEGEWIGNDTYGVVHRIASSGKEKGTGTFCIEWAYKQCGHLRIDTDRKSVV